MYIPDKIVVQPEPNGLGINVGVSVPCDSAKFYRGEYVVGLWITAEPTENRWHPRVVAEIFVTRQADTPYVYTHQDEEFSAGYRPGDIKDQVNVAGPVLETVVRSEDGSHIELPEYVTVPIPDDAPVVPDRDGNRPVEMNVPLGKLAGLVIVGNTFMCPDDLVEVKIYGLGDVVIRQFINYAHNGGER